MATPTSGSGNLVDEFEEAFQVNLLSLLYFQIFIGIWL